MLDVTEIRPDNMSLGAPSGQIVSDLELAAHLGGIEVVPVSTSLALTIGAASGYVERTLLRSFRRRTVTVRVAGYNGRDRILLPWGPASNVAVTVGDDRLEAGDFEVARVYDGVDGLKVPGRKAFTVTYDVGETTGYEDIVKMAVLRVAATLWHNRMADASLARKDVFDLLGDYSLASDW